MLSTSLEYSDMSPNNKLRSYAIVVIYFLVCLDSNSILDIYKGKAILRIINSSFSEVKCNWQFLGNKGYIPGQGRAGRFLAYVTN